MKNLRFGLLGCGKIAIRHADLLASGKIEGGELSAVCDLNRDRSDDFARRYNVKGFYSLHDIASSDDVDVLSVLTPSGLHAENVKELAAYGKPIVVEKPLALKLSDADELIEACDRYGAKLFVVKQNRFNIPILKLREALDSGRFGKLILGTVRIRWCRPQEYYEEAPWRGTWQYDGGVLTNQASHHIDLLVWMMGEVESVFAKTSRALADIEAEDTAVVTLKFRNGAIGVIEATTATRPRDLEGSLSILGSKGSVVVGGFAANELQTWQFEHEIEDDARVFENHGTNPAGVPGYAHMAYYEHVVDCVRNNKEQLVDGLGGRRSLELISAIYESIETGKEIPLRFAPKLCRLGRALEEG